MKVDLRLVGFSPASFRHDLLRPSKDCIQNVAWNSTAICFLCGVGRYVELPPCHYGDFHRVLQ